MREKVQLKIIDMRQVDHKLRLLFESSAYNHGDPLFGAYRGRFLKYYRNINNPEMQGRGLSLGKKLEILCLYGGYELIKSDVTGVIGQSGINNSDIKSTKEKVQGI